MKPKTTVCIAQNASLSNQLGLSTYLKNIADYLAKRKGINLKIICVKSPDTNKIERQNFDVQEIRGDSYSLLGNLRYSYGLYKKLKQIKKLDIIHCLYPFSSLLSAVIYKKINNNSVKIIYDVRSPWIEMGVEKDLFPSVLVNLIKKIFYKIEAKLARNVDSFIFITDGLKRFYEQQLELESYSHTEIPSGVDTNLFSYRDEPFIGGEYRIDEDDFVIGYVGAIQKMRKMDFTIHALKHLNKIRNNCKAVFVGEGPDIPRLKCLADDLALSKQVIFTGKVPYEKVPKFISLFDVGVCHLPDKLAVRYSFPLKILEYLSCKAPVLCNDIEAHQHIARDLKNVFIYSDLKSFIDTVENISYEPDDNIKNYDWENIVDRIVEVYQRCVAGRIRRGV